MRVLMISKACVVGMYQRKLEELACLPGMDLSVVVPPYWREGKRSLRLERVYTSGYQLHVLHMAFNGHFHFHFYSGLGALIQRVRPDIVHIDEEPYNLATLQAMRAARRIGAHPLFFTWQNLLRRYPYPFRLIENYTLSHASYALVGNQEAMAVLRAKGYRGPVRLVPQFGVDPQLYKPETRPARQVGDLVIGYAGRLVEEKGVHVLLKAVAGLPGNWTLRVIGDGPYRATLQALCKELRLESRVTFETHTPSREMPRRYNELDVLVLPSLTRPNWKEQFGRVLIEAMSCEVAVVGSSSGEIPNLISDAGIIVPEGDPAALRDGLARLLEDHGLWDDLRKRGRRRVLESFTQEKIAADTFAVYREIFGQG